MSPLDSVAPFRGGGYPLGGVSPGAATQHRVDHGGRYGVGGSVLQQHQHYLCRWIASPRPGLDPDADAGRHGGQRHPLRPLLLSLGRLLTNPRELPDRAQSVPGRCADGERGSTRIRRDATFDAARGPRLHLRPLRQMAPRDYDDAPHGLESRKGRQHRGLLGAMAPRLRQLLCDGIEGSHLPSLSQGIQRNGATNQLLGFQLLRHPLLAYAGHMERSFRRGGCRPRRRGQQRGRR